MSCKTKDQTTFIIAGSANMQYALSEICDTFHSIYKIRPKLVFGSSGKLTAQIQEGAPYDIFLSADTKYPMALFEQQLTVGKPETYAFGKLILWTSVDSIPLSVAYLAKDSIKHIALANPATAPYGVSAFEFLQNARLDKLLSDNLVYGENIAQVNQFIYSGSASVGITAHSTVHNPQLNHYRNFLFIPDSLYKPIMQSAVLIQSENGINEWAKKFYTFIHSPIAVEILENNGYSVHGKKE